MSTKNLSHTVIEGGRVRSNKWDRRNSSRSERARAREYLANVKKDPEYSEDETHPQRDKVYKEFDDKLGPIFRWIRAQIGRPWDEVKSEVFQTFDTRNLASSHIVYDHLLASVEETPDIRFSYRRDPDDPNISHYKNDFYVDDAGILQVKKYIPRKVKRTPAEAQKIVKWLNGNVVGKVGNKLFWFVDANNGGFATEWRCFWSWNGRVYTGQYANSGGPQYWYLAYTPIYNSDRTKIIEYKPEWKQTYSGRVNARQYKKFSAEDKVFWETIPAWCQKVILAWSPINPVPKNYNYSSYHC